jgi:hypothetical protein
LTLVWIVSLPVLEFQELEGDRPHEAPDGIQGEVVFNGGVEEDVYLGCKFVIGRPEQKENRNARESLESQPHITVIDFGPSYG